MSYQIPTIEDSLENSDSGMFSYNSHLPVRRAYEAVRCPSESSSEEEHWNNFMLFKFTISNQKTSTPKIGTTPVKRPNPNAAHHPAGKSEVLSLVSSPPEIDVKQNSEANLEENSAHKACLSKEILEDESCDYQEVDADDKLENEVSESEDNNSRADSIDSHSSLIQELSLVSSPPEIDVKQNSEANLEENSAHKVCLSKEILEDVKSCDYQEVDADDKLENEVSESEDNNSRADSIDSHSLLIQEQKNILVDEIKTKDLETKVNSLIELQEDKHYSLDVDLLFSKLHLNHFCENKADQASVNQNTNSNENCKALNIDKNFFNKLAKRQRAWDQKKIAVVVQELVNSRFKNNLDELRTKLKKLSSKSFKSQSKIISQRNNKQRYFGVKRKNSYENRTDKVSNNDSFKKDIITNQEKSTEIDSLKLQASKPSSIIKNQQKSYESKPHDIQKVVIRSSQVHLEKPQKTLINNVSHTKMVGNTKITETHNPQNVMDGNGVSEKDRLALVKVKEILEAEIKPLNNETSSLKFPSPKGFNERNIKKLQKGYDDKVQEIQKVVITSFEVNSEEPQITLINNVSSVLEGNTKITETYNYDSIRFGNGMSEQDSFASVELKEFLETESRLSNYDTDSLEMPALQCFYEREVKNLQKGYDGKIQDIQKVVITSFEANLEEPQKALITNVAVNGNKKIKKSDGILSNEVDHDSIFDAANEEAISLANATFNSHSANLPTEDVSINGPTYEELTGPEYNPSREEYEENLIRQINTNDELIRHVTRRLRRGSRKRPHFIGSYVHFVGENIILSAKTRKNALTKHLGNFLWPQFVGETSATIVLDQFACQLNVPKGVQFFSKHEQYYMCILEHNTNVYSTSIELPNEYGYIYFEDRFVFENVRNSFEINISLYSLTVKLTKTKCLGVSLPRRRPRVPMMRLIGETKIGLFNIKKTKFLFKKKDKTKIVEYELLTTVGATLNWPKPVRGFLTMGVSESNRLPTWHKRWTVLEDGQLKYYNVPSDEFLGPPIGVVDIRQCTWIRQSPLTYMMNKTMLLQFINQTSDLKVYICADTSEEHAMWLKKFKAVLRLQRDWSDLERPECCKCCGLST